MAEHHRGHKGQHAGTVQRYWVYCSSAFGHRATELSLNSGENDTPIPPLRTPFGVLCFNSLIEQSALFAGKRLLWTRELG